MIRRRLILLGSAALPASLAFSRNAIAADPVRIGACAHKKRGSRRRMAYSVVDEIGIKEHEKLPVAVDTQIQRDVMLIKEELERIREQAENVE